MTPQKSTKKHLLDKHNKIQSKPQKKSINIIYEKQEFGERQDTMGYSCRKMYGMERLYPDTFQEEGKIPQ